MKLYRLRKQAAANGNSSIASDKLKRRREYMKLYREKKRAAANPKLASASDHDDTHKTEGAHKTKDTYKRKQKLDEVKVKRKREYMKLYKVNVLQPMLT